MRKIVIAMLWAFVCTCSYVSAQSKVFNEIAGSVRTDFSEITQNRKVMGYVRLVQLEKADKNTYNYKLNILDENLNDVSTAEFSDGYLTMDEVALEGDVLCVAFRKSKNGTGTVNSAELYFVSLEGKVLKTRSIDEKTTIAGTIRNIPGQGFVYEKRGFRTFYLYAYDLGGTEIWGKGLAEEIYYLATTSKMISYYSLKQKTLTLLDAKTGKSSFTKNLQADKNFVHEFAGVQVYDDTIYYSGFISPFNEYGSNMRYRNLKSGYQKGIVVVKAWAPDNESIKIKEAKWDDGQMSAISKVGANPDDKKENYLFTSAVTMKDGNTFLFAENIKRKPRIGNIVATVVTAPLVIFIPFLTLSGYNKYYNADATVFKLSPSNKLTKLLDIEQERSVRHYGGMLVSSRYTRNVADAEGVNAYFLSGDEKNKMITNLNTRKVKYIPVSSGNISSTIFPAKEGHYMLVEGNKKTRSTKLSIVALQ